MYLLANWKESNTHANLKMHTRATSSFAFAADSNAPAQESMVDDEDADEEEDIGFAMADTSNHMEDYEDTAFFGQEEEEMDLPPGYQTTYTKSQQVEIYLLKLCTEMEAPLYAFEEIMKWARTAYTEGYQFLPRQANY
jgi:hypothetical protein